jgi:signal transduction histidine kinase
MVLVPERRAELRALSLRAAAIDAVILVGAVVLVFSRPVALQLRFFYALFLPLVWLATRHGMIGASFAVVAIQGAIVLAGELAGHGALTFFELQSLLIALAVTGLFLGVTVDERRHAEQELRRSMRMRAAGEMAAALAHELNQPLTALTSYARAVRTIAEAPQGDLALLARTVPKLVDEAERAAEVVRRLRDFFRTGATRLAPTDLSAAAARVFATLEARAAAAGVTLRLEIPAGAPQVSADQVQIEVVLRNLAGNGIEAAAAGPGTREVCVTMDWSLARVRVTVRDGGPGVPAEAVGRIFEPFETTRATGMGMGLAISRAIVEAHGGELWAEPGPPGVFRFTLPLRDPA